MKTENPKTITEMKLAAYETREKFLCIVAIIFIIFIGVTAGVVNGKYEQLEEKLLIQKKESFKIINSQYKVLNEMKDEIEELKADTTWLRYLLNKKK